MEGRKTLLNKKIFEFYRWGIRIVPIILMLSHWFVVSSTNELLIFPSSCTLYSISLYVMAYIFPLVFMLPASYFFKFGWVWRIPFWYLVGINIINASSVFMPIELCLRIYFLFLVAFVVVLYSYAIIQALSSK